MNTHANMNTIVTISESESDIHVHMDGENVDILNGIALIINEMQKGGFPAEASMQYIKTQIQSMQED